jgi:tetratricopeptide (TPR) repeat protein
MTYVTNIIAFLLLALPLASCTSASMTLYSGEMGLVTISGGGCSEKYMNGSRIALNLVLDQGSSSNGQQITGYFSGPDIQSGHFSGNDLSQLQVVYPDEPNLTQGHTLMLLTTPDGVYGELHEKPQADSTNCYFEKAILTLKLEATGIKAKSGFNRQRKTFEAESYYISGQSLLKSDKPEEAIHDLTKSLNLRNIVNPNDPDKAYPAVSIAIAHAMAGREAKALAIIRDLLGEKIEKGEAISKQRMIVSVSLCKDQQLLESEAGQKAVTQLMDVVAREFGSLNGVSAPLAACYYEIGKERRELEDYDLAIDFFQKALSLNPDDPSSIAEIAMSFVDKESPAEGRKYLIGNSQIFIKEAGKHSYDILLSNLYAAEVQQVENSGDLPRAEELSREALEARPGEIVLIIGLTRVLGKEGKYAEARKLLEDGKKSCSDETCRKEYDVELNRQDLIERIVKRLGAPTGVH